MKIAVLAYLFFISVISFSQTFEVFENDTVNMRDKNNKKQGLWLSFTPDKKRVVEKGFYINGIKNDIWITYYPSGKVKHEITYQNGKPVGHAKFYYDSGVVSEEGFWNIDHWEGKYNYYHTNGQLAYDWNYNKKGKRTGKQKYYYENGNVKYTGVWQNGKTTGALKIYNDSGLLVSERIYENGKFARSVNQQNKDTLSLPSKQVAQFTGTGNHTIYTLDGKVEKKGFFVKGKLFSGEQYVYGDNNKLKEKLIFKNGQLQQKSTVEN